MPNKHYINIAFHNYKIKCAQNQTSFYFNLKWQIDECYVNFNSE